MFSRPLYILDTLLVIISGHETVPCRQTRKSSKKKLEENNKFALETTIALVTLCFTLN